MTVKQKTKIKGSKKSQPQIKTGSIVVAKSSWLVGFNWFKRHLWPSLWRCLLAIELIAGSLAFYQITFAGFIYPGVRVGQLDLGGLSVSQAEKLLDQVWNEFIRQGIPLKLGGKQVVLTNLVAATTDPDLTYELLRFNPAVAAQQAYKLGREGDWLTRLWRPVTVSWGVQTNTQLAVEVELDRVLQYIKDSFPAVEQPPRPASLKIDLAGNISIQPESAGMIIDYDQLNTELHQHLANFDWSPINIRTVSVTPSLNQTVAAQLLPQAKSLLNDKKIVFSYEDQTWTAEPAVWHQWLGIRYNEQIKQAELTLLPENADKFFLPIEEAINQPARDAKFEIRNGRAVAFQGSRPGRLVDREATLNKAFSSITAVRAEDEPIVAIEVKITEPAVVTSETNDLGISEIIGTGHSNFKGSPPNRRHNIRVGAAALNGLLIKPGEEFSLLKALLPVDAAAGYLPELVIKGNRTVPEYGGGLCQIGTTTFRAALASGLPITARRNHSYRVVYYEPAGTDATIYDPAPDLRFINDTGSTILIQTRIEGDDLYFDFWGRSDGRRVVQTTPRIYNIVPPPPTKIIETEDLPPGEKKCTEKPHAGADAEFVYTVTYPNGEVKENVFKSHYIPWQEVCLVGVPPGTLTPPAESVPNQTVLPSLDTAGQSGSGGSQ